MGEYLIENMEIITEKGEYKEYPYKKIIKIGGAVIYEDDYSYDVKDSELINDMIIGLQVYYIELLNMEKCEKVKGE